VEPSTGPALTGETAVIMCKVDGWPAPHLALYTDSQLRHTVTSSDRVLVSAGSDDEDPASFTLMMRIQNVITADRGTYYCRANNTLGEASQAVELQVTDIPPVVVNVTECCASNNVSSGCLDICSFSIDYDLMKTRPDCLPEFHAMMQCASDGSDHRHCCSTSGVPGPCLDWCRGEPLSDETSETCAISHADTILDCFHEGRHSLPGLPRDVKVKPIDAHSAMVFWDIPTKNPKSVDLYRVFWRPLGSKTANKTDTITPKVVLTELAPGVTYEVVVKAGNSEGTSQLTAPVKFYTADQFIIASPARDTDIGGAVGIVFAVIIVIVLVVVVIYFLKKKNLIVLSVKKPAESSVSFENPFYTSSRDNTSAMQTISGEDYNVHISSSGSWASEMSSSGSGSPCDRSSPSSRSSSGGSGASPASPSAQHRDTPAEDEPSEPSPSVYQQIQMGLSGHSGFKRFK